ncbi:MULTISPECIES: NAD(P)H-dependent oxidoreductase subunit E [Psychrilyobacter]|uniref:Iron hydrogenase n=1 Tax=Psychrilyobacter piezotolerans TaxID=2293438 RepID=A0ABX9KH59_9FUSO|nr:MULTISPECIES: NAD(P)H-dependent oxidoreductase subunit E [Psychrilyobacter]MCS5422540.1 NAD(P)H-dependent oxidoreductase subunit E [Psychrilyobacter sp. S5]NDI77967.1 iron hydrogenase [Psychrilyobacter piezotolerans]RDE62081.1 iron hydrogenase [Psychrilyobacter sp. S5]REI41328.1 iron hydrogenase [Psychrilyobacter piezotolerans]
MEKLKKEAMKRSLKELIKKYSLEKSSILPILNELQDEYGEVGEDLMEELAHSLEIHPTEIEEVYSFYSFLNKKRGKHVIRLCQTISCDLKGKKRLEKQLINELGIKFGETTQDGLFSLEYCNCLGMCDRGPVLMVDKKLISRVKPADIPIIINACKNNNLDEKFEDTIISNVQIEGPLLKGEFEDGEVIKKVIGRQSEDLLSDIEKANLRGRGGAGFPTSLKWKLAYKQEKTPKYVVCNADEGEPGTFKDRYILHKHCNKVIEGMTIASYIIKASKGFIYLRGEYFYLKEIIEKILKNRKKAGLLGKDILGVDGFDFEIEIRMGAGAYICGEETALIESLEGMRGEPRNRPPYPVDTGFYDKPTIVNNVETFLDINLIFKNGVEFFKTYGTSKSTGTKFFSISGDCQAEGIYELPFGITIEKLIEKVGAENIKAVQIGGAAGRCVKAGDFKNRIAFEAVPTGGSIILFNEDRDMLEVAQNFMDFFVDESCGQCTPCREGNRKLSNGLKLLKEGRCPITYLEELMDLAETIKISSKCGLGQSSPNAFISIIENFKDEILGRLPRGGSDE